MICIEPNKRVLVKDLVNSVFFFPDSDSIYSSQIHHDKNLIIYALLFVPSFLSVKISVEKKTNMCWYLLYPKWIINYGISHFIAWIFHYPFPDINAAYRPKKNYVEKYPCPKRGIDRKVKRTFCGLFFSFTERFQLLKSVLKWWQPLS